jgi:hypothetical protein
VLAVWGERSEGRCPERVRCITSPAARRRGMSLVYDEQVEAPGVGRLALRRQRVAQQAQRTLTFEVID